MDKAFQCPGIISEFRSMSDGGWRVRIDTPELDGDSIATIGKAKGKSGWFAFSETELTNNDLTPPPAPKPDKESGEKSQAQRVRAVLFVWWEKLGSKGDFNDFYKEKTDTVIEWVKRKIDGEHTPIHNVR